MTNTCERSLQSLFMLVQDMMTSPERIKGYTNNTTQTCTLARARPFTFDQCCLCFRGERSDV